MKSNLDEVFKNDTPLRVTRTREENIVVLIEADYGSIMETFHLLKSPKNAERLLSTGEQYKKAWRRAPISGSIRIVFMDAA